MADINVYEKTPAEYKLKNTRAKRSMQGQVLMFSLMIFLTLISFAMVIAGFSKYFILPVLLLFAAVQVGLQLFYFMHMNEKGHGTPQMFMFTGVLLAFLTVLTFLTIVWW